MNTKTTEKLLDEEALEASRRRGIINRVTVEIGHILTREDMTWGEWGEVVEIFSRSISQMVGETKVKSKIKT